MFIKTKIAFAAALILGAASAALAGDSGENHQGEDKGSVAGVNHLTWSGNSANAGSAYGLGSPTRKPASSHAKSRRDY